MYRPVPLWSVALVALALAGVVIAQGSQPNFIRNLLSPIISGGMTVTGASTIGDLTVNGDAGVGKNVSIGGTLTTTGAISATAANITTTGKYCSTASCSTNYAQNDTFGKLILTGPVGTSNNLEVGGTTQSTDYFLASTGIKNTGTAAACSGNTGAVCVNDTGGLAIADGSGTTTATITAAGAIAGTSLTLNALSILTPIDVIYAAYLGRATGTTGTVQEMGATANASTITAINWTPEVIGVGGGNIVIKYCGDATCAGTTYGTITASCTGTVGTPVAATINVAAMAKAVDPFWYVSTACATTNPLGNLVAHHTQP